MAASLTTNVRTTNPVSTDNVGILAVVEQTQSATWKTISQYAHVRRDIKVSPMSLVSQSNVNETPSACQISPASMETAWIPVFCPSHVAQMQNVLFVIMRQCVAVNQVSEETLNTCAASLDATATAIVPVIMPASTLNVSILVSGIIPVHLEPTALFTIIFQSVSARFIWQEIPMSAANHDRNQNAEMMTIVQVWLLASMRNARILALPLNHALNQQSAEYCRIIRWDLWSASVRMVTLAVEVVPVNQFWSMRVVEETVSVHQTRPVSMHFVKILVHVARMQFVMSGIINRFAPANLDTTEILKYTAVKVSSTPSIISFIIISFFIVSLIELWHSVFIFFLQRRKSKIIPSDMGIKEMKLFCIFW